MNEIEKARHALSTWHGSAMTGRIERLINAMFDARLAAREHPAPATGGEATLADMIAFGASDAACTYYPDDTPGHRLARKAYCDGAASQAARIAELERERNETAIDRDAWRAATARIEADWKKAEAALAELQGKERRNALNKAELVALRYRDNFVRDSEWWIAADQIAENIRALLTEGAADVAGTNIVRPATRDELDRALNSEDDTPVEIMPDGSVRPLAGWGELGNPARSPGLNTSEGARDGDAPVPATDREYADLPTQLEGRARFLRDRGEIKSPQSLERAAIVIRQLSSALDDAVICLRNRDQNAYEAATVDNGKAALAAARAIGITGSAGDG